MVVTTKSKPFLKWAGGKGQLLGDLGPMVPNFKGRYFEPFIGGGALFFHLAPRRAVISDINPELINAYRVIQSDVEALITDLGTHQNDEDYFYQVRALDRCPGFLDMNPIRRASRLIYLNRTCYNGLHRENKKGQFNTPFGFYKNPRICDVDNLRAIAKQFQGIAIENKSFSDLLKGQDAPVKGDFLYFDPPYVPIDQDSFTSYTRQGFDMADQERLLELCKSLDKIGVRFMLSNSSAPILRDMYQDFEIQTVYAARSINSKGSGRSAIPEIVVKNF